MKTTRRERGIGRCGILIRRIQQLARLHQMSAVWLIKHWTGYRFLKDAFPSWSAWQLQWSVKRD